MVTDNYLIISSDTHAGLPDARYKEYLDPRYRDAFDEDLIQRAALRAPMNAQVAELEFVKDWYDENEEGLRGGWDAARRDAELDADGVVGEVIFPDADAVLGGASAPFGAGLGASGEYDPTLLMAGAQAHNRWLAELCSDSPDRRCGLAVVPILHDIEAAVAEIRSGQVLGPGGHPHPCDVAPVPSLQHLRYEPIWTVCEDLDMVVHTHTGPAPREEIGPDLGIYANETIFWTMRPMWFLLWSGGFERHPGLKFAVTEGGSWWAADLLWRSDIAVHERARHQENGRHRPEIRRCFQASTSTVMSSSGRPTPGVARLLVVSRSASATSCGATTSLIQKARGPTRASGSARRSGIARLTMRGGSWGSLPQRSTASTSASCNLSPTVSGPPRRISGKPAGWS